MSTLWILWLLLIQHRNSLHSTGEQSCVSKEARCTQSTRSSQGYRKGEFMLHKSLHGPEVIMFVRNTFLNMSLSCCTDAPARYKENYSSHFTIAGVKTIARYFLPNSTQTICFAEGRQLWGTSQLSSCKGIAQHLEGLWNRPHTHDHSGSWKVLLDLGKSKTLSQKYPQPGEAGRTGHALKTRD